MGKTTAKRGARPDEERGGELFQAAELERMGLLPRREPGCAGMVFIGDDVRATGWYRAWQGDGLTVVTCDFTMLEDTLFGIDTKRYLAVRGTAEGGTRPTAIAYIETREGWVTTPVPAGTRFAYAEVEYFDDALRRAFAGLGWNAVEEVSSLLADMHGGVGWSSGVLNALGEIARSDPAGPGTPLIYEGAATMLLGSLVQAAAKALPTERSDRAGILAAIELAGAQLREGASQEEAARVAGMGLTKFKRLFRQTVGSSWGAYLTERRMSEARRLLAGGAAVEQAALAVGYRSPTSFSSAFSRAFGMPPGRWRDASRVDVAHVDGSTQQR